MSFKKLYQCACALVPPLRDRIPLGVLGGGERAEHDWDVGVEDLVHALFVAHQ